VGVTGCYIVGRDSILLVIKWRPREGGEGKGAKVLVVVMSSTQVFN
jgi:hypothetical protein